MILFGDLETYSETPIQHGTYRYAETSEIMLFSYAVDAGPVKVWDLTTGEPMQADLYEALIFADKLVYHNSMFDRTVMRLAQNTTPLFVETGEAVERWHDTMVQALAHSLPGALEKLCEVLKVEQDKRKLATGKALIQLFCKPRPKNAVLRRATRETHPVEWAEFVEYAAYDIHAMREVYRKLPTWNYSGEELALWRLDQKINDRGVCVDLGLTHAAIKTVALAQARLKNTTQEMTAGWLESATKRDKLLEYVLMEHGVELPDLQKATLERRINDPELPQALRELLAVRLMACTSSTSKYNAVARGVSADGRLHGLLQFDGAARTGRWSGRLQNLMRPDMKQHEIEEGVEHIRGLSADLVYENVMQVCANAMRGVIVAKPGKKLVVADLANIEGRKAAWIAGEEWKLDAFREYDAGVGPDLYKLAYSKAFRVPHQKVNKSQRQIGKVCLAPETLVLTEKRGYIAIKDVTTEDRVWDGIEWTKQQGPRANGVKQVVCVAGIRATPDHLILTGKTWRQAQHIASNKNMLHLALATGLENLPSSEPSARSAALAKQQCYGCNATAADRRISSMITTYVKGQVRNAKRVLLAKPGTGGKSCTGTPILCRRSRTGFGSWGAYLRVLTVATTQKIAGMRTTGGAGCSCAQSGARTVKRFLRTSSPWRAGATPGWSWIESTLTRGTNLKTSVSCRTRRTKETVEKSGRCNRVFWPWKRKTLTYDLVSAGPRKRFTVLSAEGPLIVHNCELMLQYEGGVGAFITGAASYGIDLDAMAEVALPTIPQNVVDEAVGFYEWTIKQGRTTFGLPRETFLACDSLKRLWRYAHPGISSIWGDLKSAVIQAITRPGERFTVCGLLIRREGAWLKIQLPSGRFLCYPSPRVSDSGQISYMGVNQYSRKWTRINTYGGKFFENLTQAASRDVLAYNMQRVEDHGYKIVLSVHDELITEAPDSPEFNADHLSALMATVPEWAEGLPLAAAGFESYRYRKE